MKKLLSFIVVFFVAQSLFAGITVKNIRAGLDSTTFVATKIKLQIGSIAAGYTPILLTSADGSKICEIRVPKTKVDTHLYKIYNELLRLNSTRGSKVTCSNAANTTSTADYVWLAPFSQGKLSIEASSTKTPVLR